MLQHLEVPSRNGNEHSEVGKVILVSHRRIRPFRNQPRKYFDQQKLQELANSIATVGQIIPIHIKKLESNPNFDWELVDGQRRWHACKIAGKDEMKAIVITVESEIQQFLVSVVANFGRVDHTPLETAFAVRYCREHMSVEETAKVFARSTQWVYQHLKLLQLTPEIQELLSPELPEEERLGMGAALLLADVPSDLQKKIADQIIGQKMKVDQARNFIRCRAEKMGFRVGDPKRGPSKDYSVFRTSVGRLRRELEMFTQMPQSFYTRMFRGQLVEKHQKVVGHIERNIRDLEGLLAMIKLAKPFTAE